MNEEIDLAELVRQEVARQQTHQIMIVDSVREDGTVNLEWGDQIIEGIPCNQSYLDRKDGDTVLVLRYAAGWRVIDKIGGPAKIEVPSGIDLTFGPYPPVGYAAATNVYVKDGALYIQTGVGPGEPTDPPTASKPKPVTLDPSFRQGYRSGRKDNQRIAQGASPDYPKPWTSIWGFGNRIAEACAGKTVSKMQIRVARTGKYHGSPRKTAPRLRLHNHSSAPSGSPDLFDGWTGSGLGLGQSTWMTIPSSEAAKLASGAAKGLGITAGVSNSSYLICTDGCGEVRIEFSA